MEVAWWHIDIFGLGCFLLGWQVGRRLLSKLACDALDTVISIAHARTPEELEAAREKADVWTQRFKGSEGAV